MGLWPAASTALICPGEGWEVLGGASGAPIGALPVPLSCGEEVGVPGTGWGPRFPGWHDHKQVGLSAADTQGPCAIPVKTPPEWCAVLGTTPMGLGPQDIGLGVHG